MNKRQLPPIVVSTCLVITIGLVFVGLTHAYVVTDWLKLRGYVPPPVIAQLADQTSLTAKARHLLYINHPTVEDKPSFKDNCDKFDEQTIVLGCYQGVQQGIHILDVDDQRLQGVKQVTLAHETLHAAYDRLGSKEKARVDGLLRDFAGSHLQDKRIIEVLKGYEKTEPGQQLNEMHSIFGTEVQDVPVALQQYYAQYFKNRQKIVAYAAQYQAAFTTRQASIQHFDDQLQAMNATIKANTAQLTSDQASVEAGGRQLEAYKSAGSIGKYNAGVNAYNASINGYNDLLVQTKQLISDYNQIVAQRNTIAAQTQELQQALDSSKLPGSK